MAEATFIFTGSNVLADPNVGTNSSGGFGNGGTMTINSGRSVFQPDDIVELQVTNVNANGEVNGGSRIVGIKVYENAADYAAGIVKYTYQPMNPGQYANIQSDVSGLGDSYLRFNANVLVSRDPGAPSFNQLIMAAGTDLTKGPVTLNRITDNDYDHDGTIRTGTVEKGNGLFNGQNNLLVPLCFLAGTLVDTGAGPRPVEALVPGDLVWTADHGLQPLRWTGRRQNPGTGRFAPVRVPPGVLGNRRPLLVSQNHRLLLAGPQIELMFGRPEVLAAAKHLTGHGGIRLVPRTSVDYVHLLFERHEIVFAEGARAESLFPGLQALATLDPEARDEVMALFPELATAVPGAPAPAGLCRRALTAPEARAWAASAAPGAGTAEAAQPFRADLRRVG